MKPITQSEFDVATLFLSKRADHEIDFINDSDVEGVIYICIGSEDEWVGFNFKAHINKSYTAGELWKDAWGIHCVDVPGIEIENVNNITVSYNDSNVGNIDYKARIDDINKLIGDFIYGQELVIESEPNAYTTYLT